MYGQIEPAPKPLPCDPAHLALVYAYAYLAGTQQHSHADLARQEAERAVVSFAQVVVELQRPDSQESD